MENKRYLSSLPKKLDEKGRCCGKKPIIYKRKGYYYCPRCDRAFDINTKEQISNFWWIEEEDYFIKIHP